jgi:dCMP deaminase
MPRRSRADASLAEQRAVELRLPQPPPANEIVSPDLIEGACPEIDWNTYFLRIAAVVSVKSKDPRSPVGAVICSPDNVVISTGFNGFARGVFDDAKRLDRQREKLQWICHAEVNAIMNAARVGVALQDAQIYVTKFPCLSCCNAIVQAGIRRVCTHDNKFWDGDGDKSGARKLELIRQTRLIVDAPFHPNFQPSYRVKTRVSG